MKAGFPRIKQRAGGVYKAAEGQSAQAAVWNIDIKNPPIIQCKIFE